MVVTEISAFCKKSYVHQPQVISRRENRRNKSIHPCIQQLDSLEGGLSSGVHGSWELLRGSFGYLGYVG